MIEYRRTVEDVLLEELDARGMDADDFYWYMSDVVPYAYVRRILHDPSLERRVFVLEHIAREIDMYLGTGDWSIWFDLLRGP